MSFVVVGSLESYPAINGDQRQDILPFDIRIANVVYAVISSRTELYFNGLYIICIQIVFQH